MPTYDLASRRAYESLLARGFNAAEIAAMARMSETELDRCLFERQLVAHGYPPLVAAAMAMMAPEELDAVLAKVEAERAAGVTSLQAKQVERALSAGADIDTAILASLGPVLEGA